MKCTKHSYLPHQDSIPDIFNAHQTRYSRYSLLWIWDLLPTWQLVPSLTWCTGAFITRSKHLTILHSKITMRASFRLTFLNANSSLCNFWRSAEGCCPFPRINLNMTSVNHHENLCQRHLKLVHIRNKVDEWNVYFKQCTNYQKSTNISNIYFQDVEQHVYYTHSRRRKRLTTSTYLHHTAHSVKTGCRRTEYYFLRVLAERQNCTYVLQVPKLFPI